MVVLKFKDDTRLFIIPESSNDMLFEHKRWSGEYLNRKLGLEGEPDQFENNARHSIEFISEIDKIVDLYGTEKS